MSDRRIDAIRKTDAAGWQSTQLPKGSPNLVRVVSGVLSNATTGSVMHAVVQKVANGSFKLTLNGESFLIKGLPASLDGKNVAFIVQKPSNQPNAKAELFWIGASQTGSVKKQGPGQAGQQGTNQQLSAKYANILSALPTGIKTGQSISAHIEAIRGKQMSISIALPDNKELGNINRHTIQTTSINGLKEGQQIAVRLTISPNNKALLEISAQQQSQRIESPAPSISNMAHFKLATGDIAAAFVQQRLLNGLVQLNIQGRTVETPAPISVQKGDVLMLKMNKPPSDFQLLSIHKNADAKAVATLKANIPGNNPAISQNITNIRNILPNLPVNDLPQINGIAQLLTLLKSNEVTSQQPLSGDRFMQMMRNAGTGLESKLLQLSQNPAFSSALHQDLKSIMLQLANQQGDNKQPKIELIKAISELAQQNVSRIETTQALNLLAQIQGEPMRVELPMLVNQQMVNVQLSMQQQSSHENDSSEASGTANQSFNVLFSLELSQLGTIRVDANISDTRVHARIYNENSESSHFILDHIQRLETRLQQLGFKEVYLLASQQLPNTEKQLRFDQLEQMTPASLHLLDIRI